MLYRGFVRFHRVDGKRVGPWLPVQMCGVPCPEMAMRLARRTLEEAVDLTLAEFVVLPLGVKPVRKAVR
jgi:hypothetical protein